MTKKTRYDYYCNDATACRYGDMICTACHQPITEGQFRVRLCGKRDAYLSQHRACSEQDEMWATVDADAARKATRESEYKKACAEFVKKWGLPSEDDFEDQPPETEEETTDEQI